MQQLERYLYIWVHETDAHDFIFSKVCNSWSSHDSIGLQFAKYSYLVWTIQYDIVKIYWLLFESIKIVDPLNEYYKISALYFYYLYTYPRCKSLITNCQYVGTIHSRFKSHVISPCQCLSPLQHIFTKIDTCNLHIFPWSNSTCNYSHLTHGIRVP